MTDATAIIPAWNRRDLVEQMLRSLAAQTCKFHEILVIDNGSTDGTAEAAEKAGARVIRMGRNAGFAAAVNCGIKESRTTWVGILNNDVVLPPDWLERLLQAIDSPAVWFAVGRLMRATNPVLVDGTFDAIARSGCSWRCGAGRQITPELDRLIVTDMAPLTAAILRRSLFDRVGFLDERFESYLEDVDFGLRCVAAGCRGLYVPDAVAYHEGSATLGAWNPDTVRRLSRNQIWLVAKHFRPLKAWPVVAGQLLWGVVALRHRAGWAWCRGKWEGLWRFRIIRRRVAVEPTVSPEFLRQSERKIWTIQKQTGFNLYWRVYFLLVPTGRSAESTED